MRPELPDGMIQRVARKRHECVGDGSSERRHADDCPRVIEPGMDYVEYYDNAPAYQSGDRITLACLRRWWSD